MITPFFSRILVLVSTYLIPAEVQHPTRDPASERIVMELPGESEDTPVEAIYRLLVHNYAEDELTGKSFVMAVPESPPDRSEGAVAETREVPGPVLYLTELGVSALEPNAASPTVARWRLVCA